MEFLNYITENWVVISTSIVSIASIIAKLTPNQTDNAFIAKIQTIVDALALSSAPTKLKKSNIS
jgi:uncharacterized membrane protein